MNAESATIVRGGQEHKYQEEQKLYLIGLTKIAKLGPKKSRSLIAYCGGVEEVFKMSRSKLMKVPGIGDKMAQVVTEAKTILAAEAEMKFAQQHGIQVLTYMDPNYPATLKAAEDAPLIIYKKGEMDLNERPAIAIVGTRRPSDKGRMLARSYAQFFASRGFNVVSGLAFGIDSEAHEASMVAGGVTTAVLGHGLDMIYPSQHCRKARRMLENGGALVTEFPSGTQPEAFNFPARNRIISGLCQATIVVEAREKGGAQITAHFAFSQNREVYAIPGPPDSQTSIGCNRLIRDQVAKLVMAPDEILTDLEPLLLKPVKDILPMSCASVSYHLGREEQRVVAALQHGATSFEVLSEKTGLRSSGLAHILLELEINGLIRQVAGKKYRMA